MLFFALCHVLSTDADVGSSKIIMIMVYAVRAGFQRTREFAKKKKIKSFLHTYVYNTRIMRTRAKRFFFFFDILQSVLLGTIRILANRIKVHGYSRWVEPPSGNTTLTRDLNFKFFLYSNT